MIRQCAWCGCWLEPPPPVVGQVTSHGICLICAEELLAGIAEEDCTRRASDDLGIAPAPLSGGQRL
jgi:hypothetical protein